MRWLTGGFATTKSPRLRPSLSTLTRRCRVAPPPAFICMTTVTLTPPVTEQTWVPVSWKHNGPLNRCTTHGKTMAVSSYTDDSSHQMLLRKRFFFFLNQVVLFFWLLLDKMVKLHPPLSHKNTISHHLDGNIGVCGIGRSVCEPTRTHSESKRVQPKPPEQRKATENSLCPTPSTTNPSRRTLPLFFGAVFFFCFFFKHHWGSAPKLRPVWRQGGSLTLFLFFCLFNLFYPSLTPGLAEVSQMERRRSSNRGRRGKRQGISFDLLMFLWRFLPPPVADWAGKKGVFGEGRAEDDLQWLERKRHLMHVSTIICNK